MDCGLWTERGQVLIEFALAAAGIVAIAFVIARTGQWLNESMVERNANFQATRTEAGQSNSLVRFREPSPINLIGPGARRTGGVGPQPPGTRPAPCRPVVDGVNLLSRAQMLRSIANGMLAKNNEWKLQTQQKISSHHARAKRLILLANNLLTHKEEVDRLNREIAGFEQLIRDRYAANVALLHNFMQEAELANAEELIDAWQEVDERLQFLNKRIAEYNTQIRELNKVVSTYITPKLTEINNLLWNDADGPAGTRYAWPTGIIDRINQIDRLLLTDADGVGPLFQGINELITMIEGIPSNGLNDGWLEQIRNEEVFPCVTDPSCDADLLQFQMLVLEFVLSGNDTHGITKIEEFIADIDAQIGSCSDATCTTRLSTARNILTLMLSKSTATESYGLKDVGETLEFERNTEEHVVPGVDIPLLAMTVPDTAVTDLPELTILDATVAGLAGQKAQLEANRQALIDYWTDEINPRVQDLIGERKPFMDERDVLLRINGDQASIQSRETRKQNIKNQWCNFRDPDRGVPSVQDYVRAAGVDCAAASGLDCGVTGSPAVPTWQPVDAWRHTMDPLSTNPDSAAPGSGHLACMAHKVKEAADTEFQQANDLVEGGLPVDTETIQGLLDEAEALERQAREVCSSM